MFRRLGPKVILVEEYGQLAGLVTVKDVLRYTALEHSEQNSWDDPAGVGGVLEEAWTLVRSQWNSFISWIRPRT
jgi:chloride channel 3/4/5